MNEIKCPHDLNQFLLGEPIFENPFPEEECEKRKFYGDCYHCFSTAIASRDHQLKNAINEIKAEFISLYPKNYAGEPELGGLSCVFSLDKVLEILDKHKSESEEV